MRGGGTGLLRPALVPSWSPSSCRPAPARLWGHKPRLGHARNPEQLQGGQERGAWNNSAATEAHGGTGTEPPTCPRSAVGTGGHLAHDVGHPWLMDERKASWSRSALGCDSDQAPCVCLKLAVGSQELLWWSWPLRRGNPRLTRRGNIPRRGPAAFPFPCRAGAARIPGEPPARS